MPAPGIPLGLINRLIASVTWPNFPQLNVTPSFLAEEGIRISPDGPVTTFLPAMTGRVTSPEPYQPITIRIPLIKSQGLANLYKTQLETYSLLGDGTIRPDTTTLSPYQIANAGIESVDPIDTGGKSATWIVTIGATYLINSQLWG